MEKSKIKAAFKTLKEKSPDKYSSFTEFKKELCSLKENKIGPADSLKHLSLEYKGRPRASKLSAFKLAENFTAWIKDKPDVFSFFWDIVNEMKDSPNALEKALEGMTEKQKVMMRSPFSIWTEFIETLKEAKENPKKRKNAALLNAVRYFFPENDLKFLGLNVKGQKGRTISKEALWKSINRVSKYVKSSKKEPQLDYDSDMPRYLCWIAAQTKLILFGRISQARREKIALNKIYEFMAEWGISGGKLNAFLQAKEKEFADDHKAFCKLAASLEEKEKACASNIRTSPPSKGKARFPLSKKPPAKLPDCPDLGAFPDAPPPIPPLSVSCPRSLRSKS